MYFSEIIMAIIAIAATFAFYMQWIRYAVGEPPVKKNTAARVILGLLPVYALIIILFTLLRLAAFDVVGEYIFFYLLLGYMWLYAGLFLMNILFDLSWIDDAFRNNNPAATAGVLGGGLGLTLIYAGANVGDGPGWWCVFFAGGLGLVVWFALGLTANYFTKIFSHITSGRDIYRGIRAGCWLLASGLILARACAGDWTSFLKTVIEFADGWPVLFLAAAFILTELNLEKRISESEENKLRISIAIGLAYIAAAIIVLILLPPLPVNPIYQELWI